MPCCSPFLLLGLPLGGLASPVFARRRGSARRACGLLRRNAAAHRLRRQAWPAAVLRVVPRAYGAGSGASGAILSGVVLNAAFFGLGRGLLELVARRDGLGGCGPRHLVVAIGVLSAILTMLYAFQQDDWRTLLQLFVGRERVDRRRDARGAALMFRSDGSTNLAGLAWTVALLHLAGHALAKGALFLAADGVQRVSGYLSTSSSTDAGRTALAASSAWARCLPAMSLAAMPPQAGFVSEWYVFQTVFQGFHLPSLDGRLVLALAGAGLALTAAVAFATFVKVFGIGLLGRRQPRPGRVAAACRRGRHARHMRARLGSRHAASGSTALWRGARASSARTAPLQMHDGGCWYR